LKLGLNEIIEYPPVLAVPFTLDMGIPDVSTMTMTPDAKKFIFSVSRKNSDIWMLENFDPEIE
jgi:hypothetical protein